MGIFSSSNQGGSFHWWTAFVVLNNLKYILRITLGFENTISNLNYGNSNGKAGLG